MKKVLFIFLTCCTLVKANAQTGIGTTTPDASAKLDVSATNKGFLPPRVTLTSYNDNGTIPNPATGLLVYNTGTNVGLAAGYYFWNGNAWATIATAGGSGSFAASFLRGSRSSTQTVAIGGIVGFSTVDNSSGSDISLSTSDGKITLKPGITYRLIAAVPNFSGGQRLAFMWYNENSSSYIGSASSSYNPGDNASLGAFGGIAEVIITPSVSTVVSFRLLSSLSSGSATVGGNVDFSSSGSYPWFEAQVISGNAPVTGQSVDYVSVSNINQTLVGDNRDLIFTSNNGGNIPYNTTTGVFTLSANKTYLFQAQVRTNTPPTGSTSSYIEYGFVDASTNALLIDGTQTINISNPSVAGYGTNPVINFIYTPTRNQTVKIRTTVNTNSTQSIVSGTANITQIGSSAIVNPWTLSGTNTFNTTGNVGIGTNAPAQALDVAGNINVTGKINLTDASGNVATKIAAFVGRGTDVVLGNLKVRFPATGNMSLQVSTVSGTYSVYGSHMLVSSAIAYNAIDGAAPLSITTTPTYLNSGNNFGGAGNTGIWFIMDTGAAICWRISMIIGSGYTNNFISIERLL